MNDTFKIIAINLGLLIAVGLLVSLTTRANDAGFLIFVFAGLQALVNLVLMIVFFVQKNENPKGFGSLISLFLVLLIGFSWCTATISFH